MTHIKSHQDDQQDHATLPLRAKPNVDADKLTGDHMLKPNTTDRIPSTTPGAEPPRDAKDSGSARSHSMHLETSSSNRP